MLRSVIQNMQEGGQKIDGNILSSNIELKQGPDSSPTQRKKPVRKRSMTATPKSLAKKTNPSKAEPSTSSENNNFASQIVLNLKPGSLKDVHLHQHHRPPTTT